MSGYPRPELSAEDREKLRRVYDDLFDLSLSQVPSVAAAARAALAQVATALSGQGLHYELYSRRWSQWTVTTKSGASDVPDDRAP